MSEARQPRQAGRPKSRRWAVPSHQQIDHGLTVTKGEGGIMAPWLESADDIQRPARDEYVTHSSDSHGHSSKINVNIPKGYHGIIQHIVESKAVPEYRTAADFARDAIVHRMWDIAEGVMLGAESMERLHAERLEELLTAWGERIEANDRLVETARNTLGRYQGKPGWEKMLDRVRTQALGVEHPWRGQLMELVERYEQA